MLEEIGSKENVPAFLEGVKKKERKLMGFGHRIYKNYDPRARIIKKTADDVFAVVGKEPLIDIAIALEQAALSDPYFIDRKLYPNVDFYSGLIYKAMGFPTGQPPHSLLFLPLFFSNFFSFFLSSQSDFFPVLFAIPRVAGWLAHWNEATTDESGKIWRPRQIYVGADKRSYIPSEYRKNNIKTAPPHISPFSKRSRVATWASKL